MRTGTRDCVVLRGGVCTPDSILLCYLQVMCIIPAAGNCVIIIYCSREKSSDIYLLSIRTGRESCVRCSAVPNVGWLRFTKASLFLGQNSPWDFPSSKFRGRSCILEGRPVSFSLHTLTELEKRPQPLGSDETYAIRKLISNHVTLSPRSTSEYRLRRTQSYIYLSLLLFYAAWWRLWSQVIGLEAYLLHLLIVLKCSVPQFPYL